MGSYAVVWGSMRFHNEKSFAHNALPSSMQPAPKREELRPQREELRPAAPGSFKQTVVSQSLPSSMQPAQQREELRPQRPRFRCAVDVARGGPASASLYSADSRIAQAGARLAPRARATLCEAPSAGRVCGAVWHGRHDSVVQSTSHEEVRLVLFSMVLTQGSRKPALVSL